MDGWFHTFKSQASNDKLKTNKIQSEIHANTARD